MQDFLSVVSDLLLPRLFLSKTPIHLTCREFYMKSLENNLSRMFFSFSPFKCSSTTVLKEAYPKIDSNIPYVYQSQVCVLAKVSRDKGEEGLNDCCFVGSTSKIIVHLLSLLSVGISFRSLEIFSRKCFRSPRGRCQYIDLGYGKKIRLSETSIVRLVKEVYTEPPYKSVAPKDLIAPQEHLW